MLIALGFVRAAHGIRGTLKCAYITDRPETLADYEYFILTDETTGESVKLASEKVSLRNTDFLLKLEGIDDCYKAERFRNWYVEAPAQHVPPREEDEFFVWQIEGLRAEKSDGTFLGVVAEFVDTPGNPLLRISGENGDFFVVFCLEHVPVVDIDGGRLVVADIVIDSGPD